MADNDKAVIKYTMNRPVVGTMCGVAVVVLAILGLVHVFSVPLASLATVVLGVSLLFKGALITTEYSKLITRLSGSSIDKFELGGGMSLEVITGLAGIVLGILAILHLNAEILLAVAVITFGAGSIMGSGVVSRLNALRIQTLGIPSELQSKVAQEMVSAAVGTQILSGIAAIVLGILSLTGFAPITLNLVALLVLGADSLLSGSVVSEKLLSDIRG